MKRRVEARRRRRGRGAERRAWVHAAGCVVCDPWVCTEILKDNTRGRGARARVPRERRLALPPVVVWIPEELVTLGGFSAVVPIKPARLMVPPRVLARALPALLPAFHADGLLARGGIDGEGR